MEQPAHKNSTAAQAGKLLKANLDFAQRPFADERAVSVAELAEITGFSMATIYADIHAGHFDAYRTGKRGVRPVLKSALDFYRNNRKPQVMQLVDSASTRPMTEAERVADMESVGRGRAGGAR